MIRELPHEIEFVQGDTDTGGYTLCKRLLQVFKPKTHGQVIAPTTPRFPHGYSIFLICLFTLEL